MKHLVIFFLLLVTNLADACGKEQAEEAPRVQQQSTKKEQQPTKEELFLLEVENYKHTKRRLFVVTDKYVIPYYKKYIGGGSLGDKWMKYNNEQFIMDRANSIKTQFITNEFKDISLEFDDDYLPDYSLQIEFRMHDGQRTKNINHYYESSAIKYIDVANEQIHLWNGFIGPVEIMPNYYWRHRKLFEFQVWVKYWRTAKAFGGEHRELVKSDKKTFFSYNPRDIKYLCFNRKGLFELLNVLGKELKLDENAPFIFHLSEP